MAIKEFYSYLDLFKKAGSTNSAYDKLRKAGFPKGFMSEVYYLYDLDNLSEKEINELFLKFNSILK